MAAAVVQATTVFTRESSGEKLETQIPDRVLIDTSQSLRAPRYVEKYEDV